MCQRQLWLTCWKSTVWKLRSHHQPLEQVLFPKCTWLELSGIYRLFLRLKQALSPITDHWRALLWSLRSTMATVNASAAGSNTGLGWRTERSTLLWLTKECQTSHCNATSNWVLECDTDTARTGGSWSERLADDRSNCERCMVTCHTDCRQHEWWPTPESPCNCFSLAALHARRCGNIVSKLQFATRQLYPLSTTVMPEQLGALWRSSLALPLEEMLSPLGRLLRACVLPTQVNCTYGVHCCGHSRCTGLVARN